MSQRRVLRTLFENHDVLQFTLPGCCGSPMMVMKAEFCFEHLLFHICVFTGGLLFCALQLVFRVCGFASSVFWVSKNNHPIWYATVSLNNLYFVFHVCVYPCIVLVCILCIFSICISCSVFVRFVLCAFMYLYFVFVCFVLCAFKYLYFVFRVCVYAPSVLVRQIRN